MEAHQAPFEIRRSPAAPSARDRKTLEGPLRPPHGRAAAARRLKRLDLNTFPESLSPKITGQADDGNCGDGKRLVWSQKKRCSALVRPQTEL